MTPGSCRFETFASVKQTRFKTDAFIMKIGKLEQVPLRDVWEKEETDFSSWLSTNLDTLSDAIGINLELVETEKKVADSNYEIDLYCEDDEGKSVIIENQLEKTDHTHLGQVLTYLVNMEADTVIWVAKETRQEHVNVINWLNEKIEDKSFYLVKVEAYRIDGSKPAAFFSVICEPTSEIKKLGVEKQIFHKKRETRRHRKALADTIVVPAQKEGFDRVFLGEDAWYSIRIKKEKIPELKYIAGYQTAPISAVTHLAKIKSIVQSEEDSKKFKVIFEGSAESIKPIPLGKKSKIQSSVYCESSKLKTSKTVDDLLDDSSYEDAA